MNSNKELTFHDLAQVFHRRRGVIYVTVASCALLAALHGVVSTRKYESTATIQVQKKGQDRLGLENLTGPSADDGGDALADNINLQTEANILQSDTLALKTINDLHLEGTKDFTAAWNPVGWALGVFSRKEPADPASASLEDSPQRRRRALAVFSRNLTVKPVSGTRIISITYLSSDPQLAAAVVNKLIQSLISYSFDERYQATNETAGWLSGQLSDLRNQSESLQRQVANLQGKSDVYRLGTVDQQGHDQTYSGMLDKLQQASSALNQAEQSRILREAILHATESGGADTLSGLAGNSANGADLNNSLLLIQNLRGQEANQAAALKQAEAKFGPSYPRIQELRNSIAALQESTQQEVGRLRQRAQTDFDDSLRDETETRKRYDSVKAEANAVSNKTVDFAILKQESDESQKLYQQLLERFKEAGVLESLKGSEITIVDPGRVPGKPSKPDVLRNIAASIALGLLLGYCIAIVLNFMDGTIKSVDEVEQISVVPLLGVTPDFRATLRDSPSAGPPYLASIVDPRSRFIEAARAIRTEIFLRTEPGRCNLVLVTSSIPGEGKTALSANLAVLLAQAGKRVLLIDTDLRIGALHALFDMPSRQGLSELLAGRAQTPEIHHIAGISNLGLLQSGSPPTNPSELLGSNSFGHWLSIWRQTYDYIVLDSAPLLPVTDSLILTTISDLTLLVARTGVTDKSQLIRSFNLLTRNGARSTAMVLNGLRPTEGGYSNYFGYGAPAQHSRRMLFKTVKRTIPAQGQGL